MRGVYHRVKPGETLWRISKAYNVDLQELAEINNITDASRITAGDAIFIPDAHQVIDLPPVKPPAETKPALARSPESPATARPAPEPSQTVGGAAGSAGTAGTAAAIGASSKVKEESITDRAPKPERSAAAAKTQERQAPAAKEKTEPAPAPGKTQVAVKSPQPAAPVKTPETTPRERVAAAPPPKKPEPAPRAEEQGQIKVDKGRFSWPVKGPVITRFGIQPSGMKYNGIKIAAKEGTPVSSAAAGTVIYASYALANPSRMKVVRLSSGRSVRSV